MAISKIPSAATVADGQFVSVAGPDALQSGFQYDSQSRTFYARQGDIIYPYFHGSSHVAEDPIPEASSDHRGLMSASDKAKLDALVSTRIGVLGFMGAGFPDDGGWLQKDIILAAGTEFISLERFGNVIRFTVDSPVPLNCACESCSQIFWVQDETDVSAIRPPTCAGKMPGINVYGELQAFIFPASTIFDPNNPVAKLNNKAQYPALIFQRYTDSITPGAAEFECILQRDPNNQSVTQVGWAMTPGPAGVPSCVWFMGNDADGNGVQFTLNQESQPGILGALLYNGHLLTKKAGVIVGYTDLVLSNNQYTVQWWDTDGHKPVGMPFTATNVWQYDYPTNITGGVNPQQQVLDVTIDLLPVGTLVDISYFQVGIIAGTPINRYYFSNQPTINANTIWTQIGAIRFGDDLTGRLESTPIFSSGGRTQSETVSSIRSLESSQWGISGIDDPLILFRDYDGLGMNAPVQNNEPRGVVDDTLPGMRVVTGNVTTVPSRPVFVWHKSDLTNTKIKILFGRPDETIALLYPPIDVLLAAPIDRYEDTFMTVVGTGTTQGYYYVKVSGASFQSLPQVGAIRILTPGSNYNSIFRYTLKLLADTTNVTTFVLVADHATNNTYPGVIGDVVSLVHEDYKAPCVRLAFSPTGIAGGLNVQVKVGVLDMAVQYELDDPATADDDYVRGLTNYTVSAILTQAGTFTGVGAPPAAAPRGFVIYNGGFQAGGVLAEYWNELIVMQRGGQVWVWINNLLVPPSAAMSAALPGGPTNVSTPYYPLSGITLPLTGKVGVRLWPGATMRAMEVKAQAENYSEFSFGQLSVSGV